MSMLVILSLSSKEHLIIKICICWKSAKRLDRVEHPELCPMFQEPHHRRKRSANDDHENDGHSDTNNHEDKHDTDHSNVSVLALYH